MPDMRVEDATALAANHRANYHTDPASSNREEAQV